MDNPACDVMRSPGPVCQRAAVSRSPVGGVLRDVLVTAGLEKNRRQFWQGPCDLLPADCPPVTARLWRMAMSTQKARRSSSAMASGVTVTQPGPMTRLSPILGPRRTRLAQEHLVMVGGDAYQEVPGLPGADDHFAVDHDRSASEHGDLAHIRFVIDQRADTLNEMVLLGCRGCHRFVSHWRSVGQGLSVLG